MFCDQPQERTIGKKLEIKVYRCKKRFRCLESFSAYFDDPPIWKLITEQTPNRLVNREIMSLNLVSFPERLIVEQGRTHSIILNKDGCLKSKLILSLVIITANK